jgi:hypothetical protein
MTILLPALAVACAAFCVWLAVRIMNRRERWAKRTLTLLVGLPGHGPLMSSGLTSNSGARMTRDIAGASGQVLYITMQPVYTVFGHFLSS